MSMDRETLAAQLYAASYCKKSVRYANSKHLSPKRAFKAADLFLKEAERQRKESTLSQPEPPKCEHLKEWVTNDGYCTHCGKNMPKVEPAPKRAAREVWVEFYSNGRPGTAWSNQSADESFTLFREVLND